MRKLNTDKQDSTKRQRLGCIALVIVLAGGLSLVAIGTFRLNAIVQEFEARFEPPEWQRIDGKAVERTTPIDTPTLIFSKETNLAGANADIAILGGDAVLHGEYSGNVFFLGRNFDLAEDGLIKGNLEITGARHVTLRGVVEGSLSGAWDRLFSKGTRTDSSP